MSNYNDEAALGLYRKIFNMSFFEFEKFLRHCNCLYSVELLSKYSYEELLELYDSFVDVKNRIIRPGDIVLVKLGNRVQRHIIINEEDSSGNYTSLYFNTEIGLNRFMLAYITKDHIKDIIKHSNMVNDLLRILRRDYT